jgi:hypothetical protein
MNNITIVNTYYNQLCQTPSDINEHLPTLSKYASECDSVLELGVRGCVSSWAFANGLLSNKSDTKTKRLFLNDIESCDINHLIHFTKNTNLSIDYKWCNDLDLDITDKTFDIVFIDTWHVYGQLKRELDKFSKVANKFIIMHDTTVDAIYGETIRCNLNAKQQSIATNIPEDEILKGLMPAVNDFLLFNKNWRIREKYENNNGLTILERTDM